MKTLFLTALLLGLNLSCASAKPASYYRVWQGFKKPDISKEVFMKELPQFMEDTISLYEGRGLNNYLVAIPPTDKPSFIPDEFALVALENEKSYRDIRATEEGQRYGARHWDVFNRENSESSKFHNFYQDKIENLKNNHAYDMIGKPVDWTKGHTMFYIGVRRDSEPKGTFFKKLKEHIDLVAKTIVPMGLTGYIVIANENYEVAYINWESKEAMEKAFTTPEGSAIKASSKIIKKLQYQTSVDYQRAEVLDGSFIHTMN